jgi:hypothetical protein
MMIKILSIKLSIDDYDVFLMLTKLEYQPRLIKEESTSEIKLLGGNCSVFLP